MFLARRELSFARGRFALMGVVIALISVLVVLLSGLSSGLVNDGVSGLRSMKATAFAFDEGTMTDNAFSRSVVDSEQLQAWQDAEGDQVGAVNGIVVSEPLRDAGFEIGTVVTLDRLDVDLTVVGFTKGQATFGHVDVAFLPIDTWKYLNSGAVTPASPPRRSTASAAMRSVSCSPSVPTRRPRPSHEGRPAGWRGALRRC